MALQLLNRTMDATRLNEVANHPDVRPCLGGVGVLDLSTVFADPANVAMTGEHGGFVLIRQEPGLYEAHSMILPEGRGSQAMEAASQTLRYMFTATDCVEVQTQVPAGNVGADRLSAAMGFTPIFERQKAWPTPNGDPVAISYRSLTFDVWRGRDATLEGVGLELHEAMETAREKAGAEWPDHAEDPAHNRAAGAAVLMARAGNARKAVWLYNRWARLAGYPGIGLVSEAPAIIDMSVGEVKFVVQMNGPDMEVLLCR